MSKAWVLLAGLAFSAGVLAADAPRLTLWVTDSISTTHITQCHIPANSLASVDLPTSLPTLTESDVSAWDPARGLWTLPPARFAAQGRNKLEDHCFMLAIDGKLISSGVVLSSHSARLTRIPTISVYTRSNRVELQLIAGYDGNQRRLIHGDKLNEVLRDKPRTAPMTQQ